MNFSLSPEFLARSGILSKEFKIPEPARRFSVPTTGDLRAAEKGYRIPEIKITDDARQNITDWGGDPQMLDLIAETCDTLHYNFPERHALDVLSNKISIFPSPDLATFHIDDQYESDPDIPYGECSELKTKLYKLMKRRGILDQYGMDRPLMGISGMGGQSDRFFNQGEANHSWLGIHPIFFHILNDYQESVIIDPSLRKIMTLAESGYTLAAQIVGEKRVLAVFPIVTPDDAEDRDDEHIRDYSVGIMQNKMGSFFITFPDPTPTVKPDFIVGATHDYKYVLGMGLCIKSDLSYEWYLDVISDNSDLVAQVVLERKPGANEVTGISIAPFADGFKPTRLDKRTITQMYLTLLAGEKARTALPHIGRVADFSLRRK